MGNPFSAIINGIEQVAQDMESLVSKATSDLESLGIAITKDISWLITFLIKAGEDPVAAISQLSNRISSLGGDVVGTLEELASGIMTDGLEGFAQKKVSQVLAPMQESLQKNSAQGPAIAKVHQTTLKTMRMQLDALTVQGNASGLAWQGQGADAMQASFDNISGIINDLTTTFENGGPQDKLNIICGSALAGIIVVGGIILLCEFAVTCIVAIGGLVTGPGDLVILGSGVALMATTLEVIEDLVAADLLAWLLGTILIYAISHPISLPRYTTFPITKPPASNILQAHHEDQLPTSGEFPYIPPKRAGKPVWNKGVGKHGGFVDDSGNVWEWDQSGHGGPHWDVQLKGDGYINVFPDGTIR